MFKDFLRRLLERVGEFLKWYGEFEYGDIDPEEKEESEDH